MQGTSRSELAVELDRCARHCEDTAAVYVERDGDSVATDVVSALLLVAAAMDTAAKALDTASPASETALLIVSTLAGDALAAADRRGLDESLLHCIAGLRRVATLLAA